MSHRRSESGRSCIICKASSSCFWRRFIEREGKFYAGKSYEWISSALPTILQAPVGGMYLCNDCYAKNQRAVRKLKPKEFQEKEREYREAAKAKKERLRTGSRVITRKRQTDYSDDEESLNKIKRRKRIITTKELEEDYEESEGEDDDLEYTPYCTTRSKSRRVDGRWKTKDELYSPPKSEFDDLANGSPENTSSNEEGNESNTDEEMRDTDEDEEIAAILSIRLMGEAADFSLKRKLLQRFNNE